MAFDRNTTCCICSASALQVAYTLPMQPPEPYWLSGEQTVAVCHACGYVQTISPSNADDYTKYYLELNKHHKRDATRRALDVAYFGELIDYISTYTPSREAVLDFGSGALILSEMLQDRGFTDTNNWDVGGEHIQEERYHIAVSTHVFEHLYEPHIELAAIRRSLTPDGVFVLAVPDVLGYDRWYLGPYNYYDMEHINHFSPHTIALFMQRGGFEVLDVMQTAREIAPCIIYPEVRVAGRKRDISADIAITPDNETAEFNRYLEHSAQDLHRLGAWLNGQTIPQNALLGLWGIGSYAMRAMTLCNKQLDFCNDSDPRLSGKTFMGNPIFNAEAFDAYLAEKKADTPVYIMVIAINYTGLTAFIRQRYGDRVTVLCPMEAGVITYATGK